MVVVTIQVVFQDLVVGSGVEETMKAGILVLVPVDGVLDQRTMMMVV